METTYDPNTDTLSLILKHNTPVDESDEPKPGIIPDYCANGISYRWKFRMPQDV